MDWSNPRTREERTKVTLSFSKSDAELLPKLLAREQKRVDEAQPNAWYRETLTLSAALYRIVMREAKASPRTGPARTAAAASSGASPRRRRPTRSKGRR